MEKRCVTRAMRIVALLIVGASISLSTTRVAAQTGDDALRFTERFPGLNAENTGMGGVGISGVRSGAALILNPAGLALVAHGSLSGSMAWGEARDASVYSVAGNSTSSTANATEFTLGDLAYIYKAPTSVGSLVFSAAFHQTNSWERELDFSGENPANSITDYYMPISGEFEILEDEDGLYPVFSRPLSLMAYETFAIDFDSDLYNQGAAVPFLQAVRAGTVLQASRVVEGGKMREFNFGGAYEASRGIFLGASINIPYGTYTFARVFDEDDIYDDNNGSNGTTDFDYLTHTDGFESNMLGFNARFGVIGTVAPGFRLGANVETPTSLSIEETYTSKLVTSFDNSDRFVYGGGIDDVGQGVFKYTLTTPWRLGVGGAFEGKKLLVMVDVEWIDWTTMRFKSGSTNFGPVNSRIKDQMTAVFNGKLGLQYRLDRLFLRAGIGYSPDPHDSQANTPSSPAVNEERSYVSVGLGYQFNKSFKADFGWIGERYDGVYQPYNEVTGAPVVTEEHTRGRFLAGVTVLF